MKTSQVQATVRARNQQLVDYIVATDTRKFPAAVIDAAKRALANFLGVAVGASSDAPVLPVRATVKRWNATGNARVFMGGQTTPARTLAAKIAGRAIRHVHAKVHPNALITAGKLAPRTPLEGKVRCAVLHRAGVARTPGGCFRLYRRKDARRCGNGRGAAGGT